MLYGQHLYHVAGHFDFRFLFILMLFGQHFYHVAGHFDFRFFFFVFCSFDILHFKR
jgi:hypothetical protein